MHFPNFLHASPNLVSILPYLMMILLALVPLILNGL